MQTIEEVVNFVNNQLSYHAKQAQRLAAKADAGDATSKRRKSNHLQLVQKFKDTADFIEKHCTSININDTDTVVSSHLHFLPQDIEGLPKELLDELNISESNSLELAIYEALRKAGGQLPVDKILIQIYHDTNEIYPRKQLAAKLYRMASKGQLTTDPEHRGVYVLPDDFNDDQFSLFDNSEEEDLED